MTAPTEPALVLQDWLATNPPNELDQLGVTPHRLDGLRAGQAWKPNELRALAHLTGTPLAALEVANAPARQAADAAWSRALAHRDSRGRWETSERFETLGVPPEVVATVCADFGASLIQGWRALLAPNVNPAVTQRARDAGWDALSDEAIALLLTEAREALAGHDAWLRDVRATALQRLLNNTTEAVVDIARRFGISRQALMKQAAGSDPLLRKITR